MPINPRPIHKNDDDAWTPIDLFAEPTSHDVQKPVSKDDDAWTVIDLFAEEAPADERGAIGELAAGLGRGALRVAATPAYLADIAGEAVRWEGLERLGEAGAEKIEEYIGESPRLRKSASISGDIRDNPQLWTDPKWYAAIIGEGAPTIASMIIPGMAAARIAKGAKLGAKAIEVARMGGALTAGMGLEAGAAAEDIRQYEKRTGEKVPIGTKLQTVAGTGIVAGSLEAVPVFNLFGSKVAKKLIGRTITSMALEGGTEGAQEIIANAFAKAGYDADRDMIGGVIESIVGGILLGGGMGAMQQTFQERIKNTDSDEVADVLEQAEKETTAVPGERIEPRKPDSAAREALLTEAERDMTAKEILTGKKEDKLARAEALEAEEAAAAFEEPPAKPKEEAIEDDKEKERRLARIEREREEPGRPIPEPVTGREEVEAGRVLQEAADETRKVNEQAQEAAASPLNDTPEPTEAQIESGNYKKGHIKVQGLDIAVENPDGSQRTGTDQDGETWSVTMAGHYGYFKRSEGKDGEQIDVFVNADARKESDKAYIVDQVDPKTGKFDEHKVMMGYPSVEEAEKGYLANYEKGWKGLGEITEVSAEDLKKFTEKRQTKPYAEIVKKVAPEIIEKEPIKFVGTRETAKGEFPIFEDKSGFQVDYKPAEHEISNITEYESTKPRLAEPHRPTPPEAVEKEIEAEPMPEVAPKAPAKPIPSKIRTIRGAIKELGGIDFLNYTGELKDLEPSVKRTISKKGAIGIDQAVDQLIADGWLDQNTTVASFLEDLRTNPKSLLSRDRITADITTKKPHELSAEEKRLKAELEPEIEAPPEGDYITINAEDLPKGKELTLLEGKTSRGWDLYEVTAKDPFEITLMDGKEVKLSPLDKVQVLKKDVKDISAIEVIRPDGTYVDRNKIKTAEKDGLKAKYYGVYRKDGAFTAWKTKAEIDKIKKAEGKTALDLRQEYYGKQAKVAPTDKMKQRGLDLEVEDKKQPSLFEPKPIKAAVPKPTMQEKAAKPKVEKKQEPAKPTAAAVPKRQPGFAWIKGKQKPILSARKITKGKNEGKYEVVLTKGRDADGNIIPGVKRIVEERAIITMPEEKVFATKPTKPQILWRGEEFAGGGIGTYKLGKGLYLSKEKSKAELYGKVKAYVNAYPSNPLVLRHNQLIEDWLLEQSGERNIREFNKKYDRTEFIKSKGYDGVVDPTDQEIVNFNPSVDVKSFDTKKEAQEYLKTIPEFATKVAKPQDTITREGLQKSYPQIKDIPIDSGRIIIRFSDAIEEDIARGWSGFMGERSDDIPEHAVMQDFGQSLEFKKINENLYHFFGEDGDYLGEVRKDPNTKEWVHVDHEGVAGFDLDFDEYGGTLGEIAQKLKDVPYSHWPFDESSEEGKIWQEDNPMVLFSGNLGKNKDINIILVEASEETKNKFTSLIQGISEPALSLSKGKSKPQDTITRQDLQSIFGKMKNLRTGVNQAGNFYFKVEGKPAVEILEVDHISGFIQVQKGTDKERIAVGSYLKNTIELKTGGKGFTADINTAWHEFHHYLERSGIVTTNDIKALDSAAIGKAEVTEEDRATYVGDNLAAWKTQTNTRIKRILKKISDFANAVYEFFSRTRTARGVLREIETGRILRKKAPIPRERIVSPAYQQTAERFYSQVIKTVEDKMPAKMQASAVLPWLRKQPGIKPTELEWMDVEAMLEGKKKAVTRDELAGLLRENEVVVEEAVKDKKQFDKFISSMSDKEKRRYNELLMIPSGLWDNETNRRKPARERTTIEEKEFQKLSKKRESDQQAKEEHIKNTSKFSKLQLEGEKENYCELLFKLPAIPEVDFFEWVKTEPKGIYPTNTSLRKLPPHIYKSLMDKFNKTKPFESIHWSDEPNVFAHVRTNERTDADGNRVLFIEEIQSDWEQAIRKGERVPDMPFKKNWHEVVLKRMVRQAAEQRFDKIAWITGQQTADRYDLSKQISQITYQKDTDGNYTIFAYPHEGDHIEKAGLDQDGIAEFVGKEIAEKIVGSGKDSGKLSGLDLKVGGEWAYNLYDKMIPQYLKKFGKKYGAEVSTTEVDTTGWMSEPKYIGENYTIEDVKKVLVVAKKSGRSIYESPITGKKQMFPVNRVQIDEESREIQREMASGVSFSEAISKQSNAIAEIFGGNIEKITDVANVHSFTITPELKRAALFEGMPLFQTKPTEGPTYAETQEPVTEEDWIANRKVKKDIKLTLLTNVKRVASEIAEGVDKYLGAISTRLGNVSPRLKNKLRQLDFDINTNHAKDVKGVEPLLRKAMKMEKNDAIDWDYARKNSVVEKINELVVKYGMQKEYAAYRDTLDKVREEGIDVGLDIGEIEEYAPRILKDQRGFLKAINKPEYRPLYTDRLKKRAAELDMTVEAMPLDMKADIISNIILGGWSGLGGVPATRQRVLKKIPVELNKFYMDSDAALMQHLYSMRKAIEARRFFGKIPKKVAEMRKRLYNTQTLIRALNSNLAGKLSKGQLKELARLGKAIKSGKLDEKQLAKARRTVKALKNIATDTMPDEQISTIKKNRSRYIGLEREYTAYIAKYGAQRDYTQNIGAYIIELIDKREIDAQHEGIVNDILNARFHEKGTRGIIQAYKNMSYIDTMGSPISALTQIGDFAWPMFEYGIPSTLKHAYRAAMKKSKITKEDVGVERIAQEFADSGTLGNAVSKVFKWVGLEKIDAIGKETLLNAALEDYQKQAKKNPAKLKKEIRVIFEAETNSVIEDLVNNETSDNVKLLTYHKLLDFQPAGLSEVPQKYLSAGNGRLFYMLKTFTIKQFDIFRRISYNKIVKGDKAEKIEGLKNLVKMSMFFVLANAGADELKDWALGRKTDFDDRVVDNMLRLFGVSKFVTWKARTEGVGSALIRQVLFPVKFIDSAGKDIITFGDEKGLEIIGSVPVAGKLAYWHMGRGLSKREDLWDRRLRKQKAKLNKTKDRLDTAKDKMEFRRKYHSELLELKRINKLQGRLNKKRKRINELKSLAETVERKKQIQRLEVARTDMIKNFLGK